MQWPHTFSSKGGRVPRRQTSLTWTKAEAGPATHPPLTHTHTQWPHGCQSYWSHPPANHCPPQIHEGVVAQALMWESCTGKIRAPCRVPGTHPASPHALLPLRFGAQGSMLSDTKLQTQHGSRQCGHGLSHVPHTGPADLLDLAQAARGCQGPPLPTGSGSWGRGGLAQTLGCRGTLCLSSPPPPDAISLGPEARAGAPGNKLRQKTDW